MLGELRKIRMNKCREPFRVTQQYIKKKMKPAISKTVYVGSFI